MGKLLIKVWAMVIGLLLIAHSISAANRITVRIWLFQGTVMEDQPQLKKVEIMPISTSLELASAKALAGGSENDFKAAVIEALLDTKNLRTLDDLFFLKQTLPIYDQVFLGRQLAYRVHLLHKVLTPTQVALLVVLSKTKEGVVRPEKEDRAMLRNALNATQDDEKMEKITGLELVLGLADPVVVGIPNQNRPYFMIVKVTANEAEIKTKRSPTLKAPSLPNLVPAPRPVERALPYYPDELKRRGIRGNVGLQIEIDEKGIVQMVRVVSSVHSYLDYAASQAFWKWRFEPVFHNGKPIRAAFAYSFNFDPQTYSEGITRREEIPEEVDAPTRAELERILAGCARYCRKLADAAFFYICDETISETTHSLVSPDRLAEIVLKARDINVIVYEDSAGYKAGYVPRYNIMDTKNVERTTYDCDYQLIKRFGEAEERRIILKENRRKITDQVKLLEENRYSVLTPIFSSLKILDEDHQPMFNYRLLKEDRIYGRNADLIEVVPKFGGADGVRSAKVWVDKERFQILRSEIEGVPIEGYEDILKEAVLLNIRPDFQTTYEYRVEKNDLLFPERTSVRIKYPSLLPGRFETKSKIDLTYKNFKFFMVETETEIRK